MCGALEGSPTAPNAEAAHQEIRAELRDLGASIGEVNQDAKKMAADLAESIVGIVDAHTGAIRDRLQRFEERLEALERDERP